MNKIISTFLVGFTCLQAGINEAEFFNPKNIDFQKKTGLSESQLIPILNFFIGEETGCSWVKEYPVVTDLINQMNLEVGCEIGVAYGFQSIYFLENTNITKLYSIDPYRHFDDYADFMNFSQSYFDVLFYRVTKRLTVFKDRSVLLRRTSVEASQLFDLNSLDFIYIDADHSYEQVTLDLESWVPKVRSGGLVSGDDYVVFTTTAQAVNDYVSKTGFKLNISGNKWWFIKNVLNT